jgi:peroxiredoxin
LAGRVEVPRDSRWMSAVGGAAVLAAFVLLGFRTIVLMYSTRHSPGRADSWSLRRLSREALPLAGGGSVVLHDLRGRYAYVLLFFLRTDACVTCTPELGGLDGISRERPDIAAYAVLSSGTVEEVAQMREAFGTAVPFISDRDGRLLKGLRIPQTPWKVVYDVGDDSVVLEDGQAWTREMRAAFIQRLRALPRK